jgi:hypothetical protein
MKRDAPLVVGNQILRAGLKNGARIGAVEEIVKTQLLGGQPPIISPTFLFQPFV